MAHRLAFLALTLAVAAAASFPVARVHAGDVIPPGVSAPPSYPSTPAPAGVIVASAAGGSGGTALPASSPQPDLWRVGYLSNGEYQIASAGASGVLVVAGEDAPNVSIAVDGQLVVGGGMTTDEILRLGCRYQPAGSAYTGYGFSFDPSLNAWSLDRFDADGAVVSLTGIQYLAAPPIVWASHHLQLTCSGNRITAAVDGMQVGPVQDGAYQDGRPMLGVGTFTEVGPLDPPGATLAGTFDARFSHLTVTQP